MIAYIIISVIVFLIVIVSFNFDKIKGLFKKKKDKDTQEPRQPKKDYSMDYEEPKREKRIKVDDLRHDKEPVEYTEESFVKATESELKELDNSKKQSGGRLKGGLKSVDNIKVEVEDVKGNDEQLDDDDDIDEFILKKKSQGEVLADQIKNLSPEMKALIISDLLKRKDEE